MRKRRAASAELEPTAFCVLGRLLPAEPPTCTDTSVSLDVTTPYYLVLVYDFSLVSRGFYPPVSSLPALRFSQHLHFLQMCGGKPSLALKLTRKKDRFCWRLPRLNKDTARLLASTRLKERLHSSMKYMHMQHYAWLVTLMYTPPSTITQTLCTPLQNL